MKNRLALVGLAVGLAGGTLAGVTLGAPGLVGAQSESTNNGPAIAVPAKPDPSTLFHGAIDPLVANGTITQSQADAVIAALTKAMPAGGQVRVFGKQLVDLDLVAQKIGVTPEALRQALESGQSIAAVATSKGVDPQVVIDAMVAQAQTDLSNQVSAGKLTQADADNALVKLKDGITKMVNGQLPVGRAGGLAVHGVFPPDMEPPSGPVTATAPNGGGA